MIYKNRYNPYHTTLYIVIILNIYCFIKAELLPLNILNAKLSNANVQAFADNVFLKNPLNPNIYVNWLNVINNIKTYVNENNKNIFKQADPTIQNYLETIEKINMQLISSIIITHKYLRNNIKENLVAIEQFQKIATQIKNLISSLEKKAFLTQNKKNAQYILILLANYLYANAIKQIKDIKNPDILLSVLKHQAQTSQQSLAPSVPNYTPAPPVPTYTPAPPVPNYRPAPPVPNYTPAPPVPNYIPALPQES